MIVSQQCAATARSAAHSPGVHDVGIVWTNRDVAALRRAHGVGILGNDSALVGTVRDTNSRVVLLGAVDTVRELRVRGDMVELRRRLIKNGGPCVAAVIGDASTAVVGPNHTTRVRLVDPKVMVVGVRRRHHVECAPAVVGTPCLDRQRPHRVGICGVREDVLMIEGPLPDDGAVVHTLPGIAIIIGPEQHTVFSLDDGPYST